MSRLLPAKETIVYGPVRSRRLGASLGINLLPAGGKLCPFDCVYCQYGWTPPPPAEPAFPAVGDVVAAVEQALLSTAPRPDFLTFSGNGEPTLHPHLGALVEEVCRLRDRLAPAARTAILSSSATIIRDDVRAALTHLDVRIMKLDAGTDAGLARFNRPRDELQIDAVVDGLRALGAVTVQTMLCGGPAGNLGEQEQASWAERIAAIHPIAVQLYTLDRPHPSREIRPASDAELARAAARLHDRAGVTVISQSR